MSLLAYVYLKPETFVGPEIQSSAACFSTTTACELRCRTARGQRLALATAIYIHPSGQPASWEHILLDWLAPNENSLLLSHGARAYIMQIFKARAKPLVKLLMAR